MLTLDANKFLSYAGETKNMLKIFGGLSAGYVLYRLWLFYSFRRKYRHIPGPPANGLSGFFTGNVADIIKANQEGQVIADLLVKWNKQYGDVFKFQLFGHIFVVTADKDTIRDVLIVKNYPKTPRMVSFIGFPLGERFLGKGLVTESDNEKWRHRRAIFNPGFHRHVMFTFVNHFNHVVDTLLEKFRLRCQSDDKDKPLVLFREMNRTTLDAIALIAFGMHTDAINDPNAELNSCLANILKFLHHTITHPFVKYNPLKYWERKRFYDMIKYVRNIGRQRILERVQAFKNNEHMPDDILSSILRNYKDDNMDLEAMIDDFVTFFFAGQETTANTLAFCFLELGKNGDIVKKAREEIDRVLGERTEVTFQDVAELKYCSAIFKEALRLWPPAGNLSRFLTEKIYINQYEIPENTNIMVSTYMNARNEKYFKNAYEFKPERFLKSGSENEDPIENYVYHPFSLGPRNCIGQNFAQLEGVILIAKFLQKFDFRLDETQSMAADQNLTLRPKDGTRVFLKIRS